MKSLEEHLLEAIKNDDFELVKLFIDAKFDINKIINCRGERPLHVTAGLVHHNEIAKLLIDVGADVNVTDYHGLTPLHRAINNENIRLTKMLIKAGADVNKADNDGWTPLHGVRKIEIAELLIGAGADVNKADNKGETPLHWACECGRTGIAETLIVNGADVNIEDFKGYLPIDFLDGNDRTRITQLLNRRGAKT